MARKKKTSTKTTTKTRKKINFTLSKQQKIIWGGFLFLLGVALLLSFISYFFSWQSDQSTLGDLTSRKIETKNWLNTFGANIGNLFIYKGFGIASLIIAFLITLSGVYYFFDFNKSKLVKYWFWGSLVMIWTSVFFGFFSNINTLFSGVIGFEINDILQNYLGFIGTVLVMTFLLIIYFVVRLKLTPEHAISALKRTKKEVTDDFTSDNVSEQNTAKIPSEKPIEITIPIDTTSEEIELATSVIKKPVEVKTTLKEEIPLSIENDDNDVIIEVEKITEEKTVKKTKVIN